MSEQPPSSNTTSAAPKRPARRSGAPGPVDAHLGKRLRLRRMMLGLSQENVARCIGVTFQQIQKYECAINRLSAPTLWELSRVLQCPVTYFFEGMERDAAPVAAPNSAAAGKAESEDIAGHADAIRLVRAYNNIARPETRRQILDLATALRADRKAGSP